MRQKTEQETMAAERQIQLLVDALEKAKGNGGIWLNAGNLPRAKMYPNSVNVSPFNALIMNLHTDANAFKMPMYLSFNTAKDNAISVMKGQKGVPFVWYNWDTFVLRDKPEEKISRDAYMALTESEKENYKAVQKREIRTVFNLDQTTFPHKEKIEYANLLQEHGSSELQGKDMEGLKTQVNHFMLTLRENLVPIQHGSEMSYAQYDPKKDIVTIPNAKHFEHFEDYAQDAIRQIMLATGYKQRLARVSRPSSETMRQEALISELAAGIKMAELGLPARISKENLEHIDYWKQELQENPCLIDILERDVNRALDLVSKAERGEKIEFSSKERKAQADSRSAIETTSQECTALLDIIRREGEIDPLNFRHETERKAFMQKFDLNQFETERQRVKATLCKPGISTEEKEQAEDSLKKISKQVAQQCADALPEKWNDKSHNFFVHQEIAQCVGKDPKSFCLVFDTKTKMADVILPSGANLKAASNGKDTIARIQRALMKDNDASYVRFFNANGFMGYKPDDNYFRNKEITLQTVKGWSIEEIGKMKFDDAIVKAHTVIFDQAQMMKDDDGKWAFYLKAHGEDGFAIHPSERDVTRFFTTIREGDDQEINDIRNELSQKYYLVGNQHPDRKFDIFSMDAPAEDIARITYASIFRSKNGNLLILPSIEGMGRQHSREINQAQWQRLWLAPDMAAYKKNLAAKIFADVLHPQVALEEGEKVASMEMTKDRKPVETKAEAKPEVLRESTPSLNPIVKQVLDLKEKHPDAILLLRRGDFYETYMKDAETCSQVLGITLNRSDKTKDAEGKPLAIAGFPYHALDKYLPQLIRAGQRVAICDQIEPPLRQEQKPMQEQSSQEDNQIRGMRR